MKLLAISIVKRYYMLRLNEAHFLKRIANKQNLFDILKKKS